MLPYTDKIIETITKYLPKDEKEWELVGFVNKKKEIYTFGSDSKIIGRLFEVIAFESLQRSAIELGYTLHESEKQTVYPDFYFEKQDGRKIAIDIKTTYRRSENTKFGFTGGSFTSFMRNGTKNIVGNYSDYDGHYILGVVYTREEKPTTGKVDFKNLESIVPAYKNIEVFVQEKYRICGDKKGSGNTDNIGTINSTSIEPFIYGAGPFSVLGDDVFNHYWKHYPRYTDSLTVKQSLYNNLEEYFEWIAKTDRAKSSELKKLYSDYLTQYDKTFNKK